MIDELRSLSTTQFVMLVFEFSDPEDINKTQIEERIKCPLVELFDKQRNADRAKRALKSDFDKAVSLYFNSYQTSTGFAFDKLDEKLDEHGPIFIRHLGKDLVRYLRLLISIARLTKEKPKGLLVA